MAKMTSIKLMVLLGAIIALAVFSIANVSAFGSITSVEVNGVEGLSGDELAVFAGQTVPVRVVFESTENADDVRVKAWVSGARDYSVSSERFDVLEGKTYSRLLTVQMPFDIDPDEPLTLFVSLESRNDGEGDRAEIELAAQRESYIVEILDVTMDTQVKAGSTLTADVVLKNRGRQFAEDTFVRATIPSLGVEAKAYFSDLSAEDQSDPDKEDASERRLFLKVPANAPAGVYTVEFQAYNADSVTTVTKKVAVVGASEDSVVVSPVHSRSVDAGEKAMYSITLVNSGDRVRVYELVVDASSGVSVEVEEPVVAIPAGSSRTVKVEASSNRAGKYDFAVNVHSDSELVKTESFVLNVGTRDAADGYDNGGANATLILTIVLAVIFVVLLVVLIVLLTRKTEKKSEEFGESYY